MTLDALEFLRRFLQHVLPAGFQKVRHFGLMSPNSRPAIEHVRWLVTLHNGELFRLLAKPLLVMFPRPQIRCAQCGGPMIVTFLPAHAPHYFDTS